MNPETANLKQKAVVWLCHGVYDGNGEPVLDDPIEINARYETSDNSTSGPTSKQINTNGTVFVDREILVDSRVWYGELADLPGTFDVFTAEKVLNYTAIPDIKGRHTLRRVTVG